MANNSDKDLVEILETFKLRLTELKKDGIDYIPKTLENTKQKKLSVLESSIAGCPKCKLCKTRTNIVFGIGNSQASLLFVGEAPGEKEDLQGEPFVGRAGQLLTKMIEAMGFSRQEVYICNVIKCRPPNNRNPEADEIAACEPFLKQQLEIIKPKVIVGLGTYACQTLLKTTDPMSRFRGQWCSYNNIDFMPTFHPAYLLRNPSAKKLVWQDLQEVILKLKS